MTREIRDVSLEPIAERYQTLERRRVQNPFVLFLGVSGVGKSTVMREMIATRPDRYVYISPFTTRELRPGETDKTHVDEAAYMRMLRQGDFVFDNPLYGVRYGTPKSTIIEAFQAGKIPLLDFPLNDVTKLSLPDNVSPVGIYCFPPNINEWYSRMAKDGRQNFPRLRNGLRELEKLSDTSFVSPEINFAIVTRNNQITELAEKVHDFVSTLVI